MKMKAILTPCRDARGMCAGYIVTTNGQSDTFIAPWEDVPWDIITEQAPERRVTVDIERAFYQLTGIRHLNFRATGWDRMHVRDLFAQWSWAAV